MKEKKFLFSMTSIIILTFLILHPPSLAEKGDQSRAKVALVNNVAIYEDEFNRELDMVKQRLSRMGNPPGDAQLLNIKKEILETLINLELLYQESQKKGIKIEDSAINDQILMMKRQFPSEEEFKNFLSRINQSEDSIKEQIKKRLLIQQFIENQFAQKVAVSEKEMREYYNTHPDFFKQPEQIRASHILIKVDQNWDKPRKDEARKKIETIQKRLKKGDDFAQLAKEFSQCPSSANGGDLGYFSRGQMVKPFEEVAFKMKAGEVSNIVETPFGYHLIKVTDRKPATQLSFNEIKEKIAQFLKMNKVQKEVSLYLEKLREKAKIQRFLPVSP
jgi:peptidyl-prolyl cis-trans isomerase C